MSDEKDCNTCRWAENEINSVPCRECTQLSLDLIGKFLLREPIVFEDYEPFNREDAYIHPL